MPHMLFYGSLRKDQYNFRRFSHRLTYIKTLSLDGYELYNLGMYPGLVKGKGKVVVELHEATAEAYSAIRRMELEAGYIENLTQVGDCFASLFIYNRPLGEAEKVESGDWSAFLTKQRGPAE